MFKIKNTNNDNEHFSIAFILQMEQNTKCYITFKQKNLSKYTYFKIPFDIGQ